MAFESHPIFIDLAHLGQGKDLEAAGIGQDGVGPVHKLMQAAHLCHQVRAGAQVEMIGVRQNQAGANFFQLGGGDCFDGGLGADRRKDGGRNIAVGGVKDTCPGIALLPGQGKGEIGWLICHIKRGLYPTGKAIRSCLEHLSLNEGLDFILAAIQKVGHAEPTELMVESRCTRSHLF